MFICTKTSIPYIQYMIFPFNQQLKLIASQKFYPEIRDNYQAKAANVNTVSKSFYNSNDQDIIGFIHAVQVLFPLTSCVAFIVCFVFYWVNIRRSRQFKAPRDTDWSTVAAYYGISLYFTFFTLGLDSAALHHRVNGVEFISNNEVLKNLVITPFVLDIVAVVFILALVVASCVILYYSNTKWQFVCLSLAGLAPFLCVASHAHFILIAWITDPTYASGIGVFYGILFFVYFLTFKFVYHHCVNLFVFITSCLYHEQIELYGKLQSSNVRGHLRTLQRTPRQFKIDGELETVQEDPPTNSGTLSGNNEISDVKVMSGALTIKGLKLNLKDVRFTGMLGTCDRTHIKGTLDCEGNDLSGTLQLMPRIDSDRHCRNCHGNSNCLKFWCCTGDTHGARFCHGTTHNDEEPGLSFVALLTTIILIGIFLTGYVVMVACFFIFIPITKSIEDTPTQVYAIYQSIIVVLTALLAYVVVVKPGSFSITKAVKQALKKTQGKSRDDWMKIGDEERLAEVLTKAVDFLYTPHPKPN